MKTYEELSDAEREKARERCLTDILTDICKGVLRFDDRANGDGLQARIDAAFADAEANRTPWFAHEYIMSVCREDLEGMAACDAEDAVYATEEDPQVLRGIAA